MSLTTQKSQKKLKKNLNLLSFKFISFLGMIYGWLKLKKKKEKKKGFDWIIRCICQLGCRICSLLSSCLLYFCDGEFWLLFRVCKIVSLLLSPIYDVLIVVIISDQGTKPANPVSYSI